MRSTLLGLTVLAFLSGSALAHPDDRYFDSGRRVAAPIKLKVTKHVRRHAAKPVRTAWRSLQHRRTIWGGFRAELDKAAAGPRPARWCGWWMGKHLGLHDRRLWVARNWASVGRGARPGIGVVVVWRHHVGIITGRAGSKWIVKSGNDGRAVRERPRSIAGAIAYRVI